MVTYNPRDPNNSNLQSKSQEHSYLSDLNSILNPQNKQESSDINVLAIVKGQERYVFLYDDVSRAETLRTIGRFAANLELSFTWYDAAVLSQKIRFEKRKQEKKQVRRMRNF